MENTNKLNILTMKHILYFVIGLAVCILLFVISYYIGELINISSEYGIDTAIGFIVLFISLLSICLIYFIGKLIILIF